MIQWKIAIPSYKRSKLILNKTLLLCDNYNIDFKNIYVFVVKEDENDYSETLNEYIKKGLNLIIAEIEPGLHHMRNYITEYFPNKTCILSIDDDIESFYKLYIDDTINDDKKCYKYQLIKLTGNEFHNIINETFDRCIKESIGIFGIYPVKNGYFMKDSKEITTNLKFCVGCFWGCINDKSIKITIEEKEDYERTIKYYEKYNKILRLNHICVATKYYKNNGGMQYKNKNRIENSKISANYLCETYPKYCKLYTKKKSGIWEIKLIHHLVDSH